MHPGFIKLVLAGDRVVLEMSTIQEVIAQAENALDRFELDECLRLCEQALQLEETSVDALQLYASVHIELGQVETAREVLLKAISISPNTGFEKYLAVAQLSVSQESLGFYSEASRILSEVIIHTADAEELKHLNRQRSGIFCSAAELYLTDLCFEDDAESRCEKLVNDAIQADPSNPEAYRIQADLRLGQERKGDAKASIAQCLSLWKDLSFDDLQYPLYDQRMAMAKVALEVDLFEEAATVLEGLLEEDDSVIDTWYLLGIAQLSLKDTEGVIEALVSALALMVRVPHEDIDEEQKDSIFKVLQEIGVDGPRIWGDLEEEVQSMQVPTEQQ